MPLLRKKSRAVRFGAADVASIAAMAKANPYLQRLIEDAKLRRNMRTALDSSRSAYGRLTNGKPPAKALLEDKKLRKDLQEAAEAFREATVALTEGPKRRGRRFRTLARRAMIVGVAGGLALATSESLRSKVLDALFGKEEEFEYTPPASSPSSEPASPVGAA